MRVTISEKNLERLRSFLSKKEGLESEKTGFAWLGKSRSPSYTVDDAIGELLSEVGF